MACLGNAATDTRTRWLEPSRSHRSIGLQSMHWMDNRLRGNWWNGFWPAVGIAGLASLSLWFVAGGWVNDDFVHIARLSSASVHDLFGRSDPFGFYRPVAHLTLLEEGRLFGFIPAGFRLTNVLIHIVVCLLVHRVARYQLEPRAAFLATVAFVMTPKAHTVAVLWASARPELVMSLFSLLAILCWLRWEGNDARWLFLTAVCYVLAVLAKETAALLPILLLFSGTEQCRLLSKRRLLAAAAISVSAVIPLYLRILAGGLMPISGDQHYSFDLSARRLFRSFEVYLPRALPSAAALLLVVGLPGVARWRVFREVWTQPYTRRLILYGLVWFLVFMLPVFPIPGRSELYLYLPGAGWCFLAGHLADRMLSAIKPRAQLVASLFAVYVAALLSYQITRNIHAREIQTFTAAFVQSIREDQWFRLYRGSVLIVPVDNTTERLLREGVSGYGGAVVSYGLQTDRIQANVAYSDQTREAEQAERVFCTFSNAHVLLRRTGGSALDGARERAARRRGSTSD